jgi:hypothetical protein
MKIMKKILLSSVIVAFFMGSLSAYGQKQEKQDKQVPQKNCKATFAVESHDFGTINESDGPVTFVFEFTNSGTDPLLLKNVQASCGCTTPDWPKDPILPGKKGIIKVTYNPAGRPDSFEKNITVTSDGNPGTQVLKIKGIVSPKPQPPMPQVKTDTVKKK